MTRSRLSHRLASMCLALPLAIASLGAVAQDNPTPEVTFQRADANADGKLSKEEAMRLPAISAKFVELDKNKDSFLSLEEFMAAFKGDK